MPDVSELADALIFLLPGVLVVLGVIGHAQPRRVSVVWTKLGFGEILIGLLAASLIGIVSLGLSELIRYPLSFLYGEGVLQHIMGQFREHKLFEADIAPKLNLEGANPGTLYQYAEVIVQEHAPRNAEMAQRLRSLSLMCRSLP